MRLGASIFALFLIVGQMIFAAGAFINAHWLCYLGRFTFGIGGESLAVAQNTYTVTWFSGTFSFYSKIRLEKYSPVHVIFYRKKPKKWENHVNPLNFT